MKNFFGLVILVAGCMLLAINMGLLNGVTLWDLYVFWPALLVLLGVQLMTKNMKYAGVIQVVTLVALVAGAIVALPHVKTVERDAFPGEKMRMQWQEQVRGSVPQYEVRGDAMDLFRAPQ